LNIPAILDMLTKDYGYVASLVALAFLVISFSISYRNRNKLMIKILPMSKDLPRSFKGFNKRIRNNILRISQIHRQTKEEAGDINIFRELSMPARGETIDAMKKMETFIKKEWVAPVKLLELIFQRLYRPPMIEVDILIDNYVKEGGRVKGDLTIECRYIPRESKSDIVQLEQTKRSGVVDKDLDGAAEEVSLKILILLSENEGTKSWEALKYITFALDSWPPCIIKA